MGSNPTPSATEKMRKYFYICGFLFILFICFLKFFLQPFVPLLWLKVDEAFHKGDYKKAEEYLGAIIWLQPKNPSPYILKGWLEWSEAKYLQSIGYPYEELLKKAEKTYKIGEKRIPENWQLYFEEGIMWEAFGRKEESLKAYYLASKYAKPPYNRIYYYKKKEFEKE